MKNKILAYLYNHRNEYTSGEMMSSLFNMSRAAIFKHIKKLREDGHLIEAITNKGYKLISTNDMIIPDVIKANINSFYSNITYLASTTSTNDVLKHEIDLQEGSVLIANHQTHGKGRNGRSFISQDGSGIYLSIYLKPNLAIDNALKITACVAVGVQKAISKIYKISPKIKWVNDIMIDSLKVAGILCEASLEMNTAIIDGMVVGIGINVHPFSKPLEIKDIAGFIEDFSDIRVDRNTLISEVLNQVYYYYSTIDQNTFLKPYVDNSNIIGQRIEVSFNNEVFNGLAESFNESGHLIVRKENNEIISLHSGEVSIRKK